VKRLDIEKLVEHPEGGRFLEVFRSSPRVTNSFGGERAALTHIYFSLNSDEVSRFHKVASDEVWNLYAGEVTLYIWDDAKRQLEVVELSAKRQTYCAVVGAGLWQAARPMGGAVLVGCSVAPGFEYEDFMLIDTAGDVAARILEKAPELNGLI